jgi:hypothetical protein
VTGVQTCALPISGGLDGVGVAGVTFISTDDVAGGLVAPVTVVAGALKGVQFGVVEVATAGVVGAQLGVANVAAGGVGGVQAGVSNVAVGGLGGVQGGVVNVASAGVVGAQVGVLNIGGDVTGTQVGVVNIASTVKGAQLGLLNISKDTTVPVGLVNVITDGTFRAAVWANETQVVNVAAKLGSRHVYSHLVVGLNPRAGAYLYAGLGLGLHLDFGAFYGQLEGDVGNLYASSRPFVNVDVLLVSERLVIGYQVSPAFSVFAGPSFSQVVSFSKADVTALSPWGLDVRQGTRLVPGFVAGVQLF